LKPEHYMRALAFLSVACLAIGMSTQSLAEGRVALVIGNSSYQYAPSLPNPANDAEAIALLLKGAGFDKVETHENLGVGDMRRVVRNFSDRTRDADIALIYYAGHGMEVGGANYLVPIDAALRRDIDVEDETVSLERLLQVMEPAKRRRLIILDAFRDNPFVKTMARTMASRAIRRGLARVEPATSNTLIAFAAKAGMTAADGERTHSPFTSALLKYLVAPGLDVRLAFGQVRDDVLRTTSNQQEPFVYGSLGGSIVTLASVSQDERIQPASDSDSAAARDYEAAAKVGSREAWGAFLVKYPTGFYADLARAQRAKLFAALPAKDPERPLTKNQPNTKPEKKKKASAGASGYSGDVCVMWRNKFANGEIHPQSDAANYIRPRCRPHGINL
jgi:uncharacterized caspase-like protein